MTQPFAKFLSYFINPMGLCLSLSLGFFTFFKLIQIAQVDPFLAKAAVAANVAVDVHAREYGRTGHDIISGSVCTGIAEESRTHTVLLGKYLHLWQTKCSQYLILLRIFSLHLPNICSRKTAQHPPALNFLMDFVKASRSKIRILQDEIWQKTRKILAAGRVSSALFGYSHQSARCYACRIWGRCWCFS